MKTKSVRLNGRQVVTMAAILGLSNAGQDQLFNGPHATVTPIDAMDFYTSKPSRGDELEDAVICFGGGIFENEEMLATFVNEAKSWKKILKSISSETIKSSYPRYASFVDAIVDQVPA